MKSLLGLLPVCLLFFWQFSAKGQSYKPVLGNTNEWYYHIDHGITYLYGDPKVTGHPMYVTYSYPIKFYTQGDTMLSGRIYKKLYLEAGHYDFYSFYNHSQNNIYALLREDTLQRKIFDIDLNWYPKVFDSTEKLLFDYNLNKNDSFYINFQSLNYSLMNFRYGWEAIADTGTINNPFGNYSYIDIKNWDRWLEGIGSLRSIFYMYLPPNGADFTNRGATIEKLNSFLTCAFKDEVQTYADQTCSHPSSINNISNFISQINVYGNNHNLFISYSGDEERAFNMGVCDLMGRQLYRQDITLMPGLSKEISLKNTLIPGIYIVAVESGNSISTKKVEIR